MSGSTRIRADLPVAQRAPAVCCSPLAQPDMTGAEAEVTARLFKALSDPSRVLIVNLLANSDGAVCVCDLNVQIDLSQPTLSHHLKKLVASGLLTREQRGVWAFYDVDRAALARLGTVFQIDRATERSLT
ncbi:MAG: metalloregulator ArsR/SmtB family transcription factor [Actinomycetota bacterium]